MFMQAAWTILFLHCYMLEHLKILKRNIRVEGIFEDHLVQPPFKAKFPVMVDTGVQVLKTCKDGNSLKIPSRFLHSPDNWLQFLTSAEVLLLHHRYAPEVICSRHRVCWCCKQRQA